MTSARTVAHERIRAATLAVGTEITDGQIVDRNSGWISALLSEAGLLVVEHRSVADDREDIRRALRELAERSDFLFVTGGLGPTSDDFTRELIAEVFARPLEFDPGSWEHVSRQLLSRGLVVREIQRQQCFFPRGSRIFTNSAGTANAFAFEAELNGKTIQVYALPGPPVEIAAVWKDHVATEIERVAPPESRERLAIFRVLGRGESQVAEVVEGVVQGSGLRVGYRAHAPYVEVKIWYAPSEELGARPILLSIEDQLRPWLVNRDQEDVVDGLFDWLDRSSAHLQIVDAATNGILHERLAPSLRQRKVSLSVTTCFDGRFSAGENGYRISLAADEAANLWRIGVRTPEGHETILEERPVFNYKVRSERARKFITERLFLAVLPLLNQAK